MQIRGFKYQRPGFGVSHTRIRGFTYRDSGFHIPKAWIYAGFESNSKPLPRAAEALTPNLTLLTHRNRLTRSPIPAAAPAKLTVRTGTDAPGMPACNQSPPRSLMGTCMLRSRCHPVEPGLEETRSKAVLARIVAISDFCTPLPVEPPSQDYAARRAAWRQVAAEPAASIPTGVHGGYLERLPLAAAAAGLCSSAEIWSFSGTDRAAAAAEGSQPLRRCFRADGPAPYPSADLLAHLDVFGPPAILCTWGLGIEAALLERCRESVRVYNSIDAPALRIPEAVSRHVDLFLASAPWQAAAIRARHRDALVAVMPIGPEFASPETFFPTGAAKDFDVIYVAAAQALQAPRHPARRLRAAASNYPRPLRLRLRRGRRRDPRRDRRARAQHHLHRPAGRLPIPRSTR